MRNVAVGVAVLVALLLAIFVWPTRFRYETASIRGESVLIRVDRLSDRMAYLDRNGWKAIGARTTTITKGVPCTADPSDAYAVSLENALGCDPGVKH